MTSEQKQELSMKESKIIDLFLEGNDNKEIAKQLNVVVRTVKMHFNRMFVKFGLDKSSGLKRVKLAVLMYNRRQNGTGITP